MTEIHRLELNWIVSFQGDGGAAKVMTWLSWLGYEALVYVPLFIYFVVSRKTGTRVYLLLSFGGPLLETLKLAFHSPRPYWVDTRIKPLSTSGNYGLPSGHVWQASIVWSSFASAFDKAWARVLALILVLLVCVSRIYLGVHFISDVAVAWAIAAGIGCCYNHLEIRMWKCLSRMSLSRQVLVIFSTATVLLFAGEGVRLAIDVTPDPAPWSSFATAARNLGTLAQSSGGFFGAACGLIMAKRWANFDLDPALSKRIAVFAYALGATFLIKQFNAIIPSPHSEALWLTCNFVKGAISNWGILFLAPWLLFKLNLPSETHPKNRPITDSSPQDS